MILNQFCSIESVIFLSVCLLEMKVVQILTVFLREGTKIEDPEIGLLFFVAYQRNGIISFTN